MTPLQWSQNENGQKCSLARCNAGQGELVTIKRQHWSRWTSDYHHKAEQQIMHIGKEQTALMRSV